MRYDAEHKQKTRLRVLDEAAKAIREEGPHRVGVAGVMARAGLTHGGFYAHFPSKEAFVAEAIAHMFEGGPITMLKKVQDLPPREALEGFIDFYLSARHRDSRSGGCPLPYLAGDAPRLTDASRERYAQGANTLIQVIADRLRELGRPHAEDEASSMLSELVGAVTLARAEGNPDRSDAILERSRAHLKRRLGLEPAQ
ncbi:TetR/AcrR family transcriptional regulator [Caulobacter segnis]|uniref:TetR/AcrR family transcriptional regulator n=1 Tax=Caulobacter segnis TaxID=88688 RepID=A0A2W5V506_9CAUL|nr:TetR/AcrR family transcriptional regulator [Caulobacter segnis]PZR31796.1 MAG: TetR/AcrR family transcriptional regulator [Caulobacter segnis]